MIWAGFGPIGNTEKKSLGWLWATFEDGFFMFSAAIFFLVNVVASALKNCIISIWEFFLKTFFAPENMKKLSANCVLLYWRHLPARLLYNDFDSIQLCIEIWSKIYWMTFIQLIVKDSHSNGNKLIFETFFLYKSYKICNWTINQVLTSKYLTYANNVVWTFFSFQKSSRMLPLGFLIYYYSLI